MRKAAVVLGALASLLALVAVLWLPLARLDWSSSPPTSPRRSR
ncbi:MAG: hypothetical protein R2699_12260 [Acidimicrobiales bacterium]